MSSITIENARVALNQLKIDTTEKPIPKTSVAWGGANVVISEEPLSSGYREIVTPYALEISWLFTSLRNIFVDNRLIDSSSKFEFYGRLEIAANLSIHSGRTDLVHIAQAILEAAELMLKEMSEKRFYSLSVSRGTEIAADHGTQ